MTPEKQRIAIAEACGGQFETQTVCPCCKGVTPYEAGDDYGITIWNECQNCSNTGEVEPYSPQIPDYLNDLDAMHEAESRGLRDGYSYWKFIELLDSLVKHGEHVDFVADRASATAAQRAEAFLRTLNLWIED